MHISYFSVYAAGVALSSASAVFGAPRESDSGSKHPRAGPALKVAVIGAGAGGSSAAFFLGKAKERFGRDIEIDVFERNSYIGGRSTIVHPYDDASLAPREAGAAIFISSNKNLLRAATDFNIPLINLGSGNSGLGVWDGSTFPVTLAGLPSDTDLVAKYGLSSIQTASTSAANVAATVNRWYIPDVISWNTVEQLSQKFGFVNIVSKTLAQWFDGLGVNPKYTREFLEATARANYAQDSVKLHGLAGAVSLAVGNSFRAVAGGNYKLFEGFLSHSTATVHLSTKVVALKKVTLAGKAKWIVTTKATGASSTLDFGVYDYVMLAAPAHLSDITLIGCSPQFSPTPYVDLHVTFISTTSRYPQTSFFGLNSTSLGFTAVLTSAEAARAGGASPDFLSIGNWGTVSRNGTTEYIYKTLSLDRKSDKWLKSMYGSIGWVYRKPWKAFPVFNPRTTYPPVKPDDGLFYISSLEPWLSSMETQTVSGRNAVDLLLKEVYGVGICYGNSVPTWTDEEKASKVYGWDC